MRSARRCAATCDTSHIRTYHWRYATAIPIGHMQASIHLLQSDQQHIQLLIDILYLDDPTDSVLIRAEWYSAIWFSAALCG